MEVLLDNKLTPNFLKIIEKYLSINLPKPYRNYLLKYNGGVFTKDIFYFKNQSKGSVLDYLFGIVIDDYENLLEYLKVYKNRIPKNFIPIGRDPGSNLILLSVSGNDYGKVYFWDHEQEVGDGETPDYSNLTLIADTFTEFIEGLKDE